jgi:hypothetical protein
VTAVLAAEETSATEIRSWWSRRFSDAGLLPVTSAPSVSRSIMRELVGTGLLALPRPGSGRTKERMMALAALGELDLTIGRLAEAHTDALAILADLRVAAESVGGPEVWAVWAAEPPGARVVADATSATSWQLTGRKAWCSGASGSTHALVTAHAIDGRRLFAVDLGQPAVRSAENHWAAPALAGTDTVSVDFDKAIATPVGVPDGYLDRPGFWHGAIGVSAVWYGGAVSIARTLLDAARRRDFGEIDRAHLGAVSSALTAARAVLVTAAVGIDEDPQDVANQAAVWARQARAVVEAAAALVIDRVGRALGPGPLATNDRHLRQVADLQLYLRQSHADRDLADLGGRLQTVDPQW